MLSFVGALLLKKRDFTLRIWEKLFERRIKAHENVIALALEMRLMVALGGFDDDGEVCRAPQILISRDEFEKWFTRFTQLSLGGTTWLTTDTKRELNFVQDYLITLHQNLLSVSSDKYISVGEVIRHDFINLSGTLEKKAFEFFEGGVRKLKLDSLNQWHKYQRPVTESRLKETMLLRNWEKIRKIAEETSN